MTAREPLGDAVFAVATAAQRCLSSIAQGSAASCLDVVDRFLSEVRRRNVPRGALEPLLARFLAALAPHLPDLPPSLVARALACARFSPADPLVRVRLAVAAACDYPDAPALVQHAARYLRDHAAQSGPGPRTLGAALGRHPRPLARQFHRTTALTVQEYLRLVRLARAATLLSTTAGTVKEVWSAVGYNHASTFTHHFGRLFGCSPRQFREAHRSGPLGMGGTSARTSSLDRAHASPPPSASPPPAPCPGLSVLLVDDDRTTRELVGWSLRRQGYAVRGIASAAEALAAVQPAPDAVLLDYRLPDLDGLVTLRALRERGLRAPVVLFTADTGVADRQDELTALGATVLLKPCNLDSITATVGALVDAGSTDLAS